MDWLQTLIPTSISPDEKQILLLDFFIFGWLNLVNMAFLMGYMNTSVLFQLTSVMVFWEFFSPGNECGTVLLGNSSPKCTHPLSDVRYLETVWMKKWFFSPTKLSFLPPKILAIQYRLLKLEIYWIIYVPWKTMDKTSTNQDAWHF